MCSPRAKVIDVGFRSSGTRCRAFDHASTARAGLFRTASDLRSTETDLLGEPFQAFSLEESSDDVPFRLRPQLHRISSLSEWSRNV